MLAYREGPSAVAGIIDQHGGLRVVVSEEFRILQYHVGKNELCFVVPGFLIQEPVPWNYIPTLIRRVELYIAWFRQTRNDSALENNPAIMAYQKRIVRDGNARQ
jgi:hypothetical protein